MEGVGEPRTQLDVTLGSLGLPLRDPGPSLRSVSHISWKLRETLRTSVSSMCEVMINILSSFLKAIMYELQYFLLLFINLSILPEPSSLNLTGNGSLCQETNEVTRLVTGQFRTSSKWFPAGTIKIFLGPIFLICHME